MSDAEMMDKKKSAPHSREYDAERSFNLSKISYTYFHTTYVQYTLRYLYIDN